MDERVNMINELKHIGILGMKWGHRGGTNNFSSGNNTLSTKIKVVSKQKILDIKKNLKTVTIVGGILGGTVGTIVAAKLMNRTNRKRAMAEAINLTKKWQAERNARNVIHLPAHLPRTPLKNQDWYQTYKKHSSEMEAIANTLKRGGGTIHNDVPRKTLVEMERVAKILRNGGLS